MSAAIYNTVSATVNVNSYNFKANGQTLKFKGFMTLYVESLDNEQEESDENIPELIIGQEVIKEKLDPKQSFTEPPPRYTEASLVKSFRRKRDRKTKYIFAYNYYYFRKTLYTKRAKTIGANRTWKSSKYNTYRKFYRYYKCRIYC